MLLLCIFLVQAIRRGRAAAAAAEAEAAAAAEASSKGRDFRHRAAEASEKTLIVFMRASAPGEAVLWPFRRGFSWAATEGERRVVEKEPRAGMTASE